MKDTNAIPQSDFFQAVNKLKEEKANLTPQEKRDRDLGGLGEHPGWKIFKSTARNTLLTLKENSKGMKAGESIETCLLRKLTVEAVEDYITTLLSTVDRTAEFFNKES
jgi:hypothetical protein